MEYLVCLYSEKKHEINRFLNSFYNTNLNLIDTLKWDQKFDNPTEMVDLIGVFIDNKENYSINMWISIDKGYFINVTEINVNKIIEYLYERFPY